MPFRQTMAATLAMICLALPALPWNATGHRVIASIAYDNLTPAARARVDDLIRRHPDYQSLFLKDAPADPAQRDREAFLAASVWPDQIRTDPRFYDDTQRSARPTPLLAGFPDMGRHTNWHYIGLPFTQDGTRGPNPARPNVVTELERLIEIIGRPPADAANPVYALPWFLHLAGDLHNPVHSADRFSRELPGGDHGGNLVYVEKGQPLHLFWDDLLGSNPMLSYVVPEGQILVGEYGAKGSLKPFNDTPAQWAEESFHFVTDVYSFGRASGSKEKPVLLSSRYKSNARRIARGRAVEAGLRMASILNQKLK